MNSLELVKTYVGFDKLPMVFLAQSETKEKYLVFLKQANLLKEAFKTYYFAVKTKESEIDELIDDKVSIINWIIGKEIVNYTLVYENYKMVEEKFEETTLEQLRVEKVLPEHDVVFSKWFKEF